LRRIRGHFCGHPRLRARQETESAVCKSDAGRRALASPDKSRAARCSPVTCALPAKLAITSPYDQSYTPEMLQTENRPKGNAAKSERPMSGSPKRDYCGTSRCLARTRSPNLTLARAGSRDGRNLSRHPRRPVFAGTSSLLPWPRRSRERGGSFCSRGGALGIRKVGQREGGAFAERAADSERAADRFEFAPESVAPMTPAEMLGQARVSARCQFSVKSERARDSRGPAVVRRVVHRTRGRR
jgi:hypothetical protein